MSNVLNRTTKEYLLSVNTPEYPVEDFIINPNVDAVTISVDPKTGVRELWPTKYWIITGDAVTLMDQAARDAVDAAELSAKRDVVANKLDQLEAIDRALALANLAEFNSMAGTINAILNAADKATSLADFQTRMRAIPARPDRTIANLKTVVRNKLGN